MLTRSLLVLAVLASAIGCGGSEAGPSTAGAGGSDASVSDAAIQGDASGPSDASPDTATPPADASPDASGAPDSDADTDAGPTPQSHSFPRIGTLQWGSGPVDWMQRFHLIITGFQDAAIAAGVKQARPDRYVLWTTDWNAGGPFGPTTIGQGPLPSEWRLKTSTGADVTIYGSDYFADITELCAGYTGTINGFEAKGERYNEAIARFVDEMTDWSAWDGVNSDGTWQFPGGAPDLDLDRDGQNDFTQESHGATEALRHQWVEQKWWEGQDAARSRLRALYEQRFGNANAKLITYWTVGGTPQSTGMSIELTNGVGWENMFWNGPAKFESWPPLIEAWETKGPSPRVNFVSGDLFYDAVHAPARRKDYFRFVRWGLAIALLHDVYFMSGDLQNHHWSNYYDEYDVKLGYPKGPAVALASGGWTRFFDHGAVLVNPTNSSITITDSSLQALAGYAGPYYRFRGNQDPAWNDGSQFDAADFPSTPARVIYDNDTVEAKDRPQNVGEGLVLVDSPDKIVVADIIVDNAYSGTSPGSQDTELDGFVEDLAAGHSAANPVWTAALRYQKDWRYFSSHSAAGVGGPPTASAVYHPGIRVAGNYRVYEWHGWAGSTESSKAEAAAVPVQIVHASGTASLTIDQTKGYGAWNLLGTYFFEADGSATLTLTNKVSCSSCQVIADAFKLEYVPEP